jgi:hypothetical protein
MHLAKLLAHNTLRCHDADVLTSAIKQPVGEACFTPSVQ